MNVQALTARVTELEKTFFNLESIYSARRSLTNFGSRNRQRYSLFDTVLESSETVLLCAMKTPCANADVCKKLVKLTYKKRASEIDKQLGGTGFQLDTSLLDREHKVFESEHQKSGHNLQRNIPERQFQYSLGTSEVITTFSPEKKDETAILNV